MSVGMSKATESPPPPRPEDHVVALVGLLGVAEARELPDRPRPAAVAGRVEAAGERELPRPLGVVGAVGRLHLHRRTAW